MNFHWTSKCKRINSKKQKSQLPQCAKAQQCRDLTAELQAGPEHQRFPVFGGLHAGSSGPGIHCLGHLGGPQWHRVNRPAPSPSQGRSGHLQPDHRGRCHCLVQWRTHLVNSHNLALENINMQKKMKFHTQSVKVEGTLFHPNLMGWSIQDGALEKHAKIKFSLFFVILKQNDISKHVAAQASKH